MATAARLHVLAAPDEPCAAEQMTFHRPSSEHGMSIADGRLERPPDQFVDRSSPRESSRNFGCDESLSA